MVGRGVRSVKNMQFSSEERDRKILSALFCAGLPACIGFCIEPPPLELDYLRLFDAIVFSLLGFAVWGAFHLFGFHNLSGKRFGAMIVASGILWVLLAS